MTTGIFIRELRSCVSGLTQSAVVRLARHTFKYVCDDMLKDVYASIHCLFVSLLSLHCGVTDFAVIATEAPSSNASSIPEYVRRPMSSLLKQPTLAYSS